MYLALQAGSGYGQRREVTDPGADTPQITLYWGDDDAGAVEGSWDASVSVEAQAGTFDSVAGGLTPATTYYFRSFAQNSVAGRWASPGESPIFF